MRSTYSWLLKKLEKDVALFAKAIRLQRQGVKLIDPFLVSRGIITTLQGIHCPLASTILEYF